MASGSWTEAIGAATLPDVAAGRPRPHRSTATTCCLVYTAFHEAP